MRLVPCCQICAEPQDRGLTPISWLRLSSCTAVTTAYTASNSSAEDSWWGEKAGKSQLEGQNSTFLLHLGAAECSMHSLGSAGTAFVSACFIRHCRVSVSACPCSFPTLSSSVSAVFPFLIKGGFLSILGVLIKSAGQGECS